MPWTAGTYTRGYASWVADANSSLPISATKFDTEDNDFAAGLNNCLTIDGLNKPTSNLTWSVQMNWTKSSDGNIWSIARTGGSNNPKLQGSLIDASGVTLAATGGSFTVSGTNGFNATAAAGGIALTATAGGLTATATAGTLALLASAANVTFNGTAITGQGPVAAAMVDMTPDQGSWTSTLTGGFTGTVTGTLNWQRMGNHAHIFAVADITGTSNAVTDIVASAVPAAITPTHAKTVCGALVANNGAITVAAVTVNTNNTLTIQVLAGGATVQVATNGWTNSGTRGIKAGFDIYYCLG